VQSIKKDFPYKPIRIPPPIDDSREWKKLDTYPFEALSENYVIKMKEVIEELNKFRPKRFTIASDDMTCGEYASFLEYVADAVNIPKHGFGINFDQLMTVVVNDGINAAKKCYSDRMSAISLPMDDDDWEKEEKFARTKATEKFEKVCPNKKESSYHKERLKSAFFTLKSEFWTKNVGASEKHCKKVYDKFLQWLNGPDGKECDESATCSVTSQAELYYKQLCGPRKFYYKDMISIAISGKWPWWLILGCFSLVVVVIICLINKKTTSSGPVNKNDGGQLGEPLQYEAEGGSSSTPKNTLPVRGLHIPDGTHSRTQCRRKDGRSQH